MVALPITPRRFHLTRLMSIWRSAGWPCHDAVELDLVAAGWATIVEDACGHETIRLTEAGIRLLAAARQRNQRALSAHDQLVGPVAAELMAAGRIVWRELSLRARITQTRLRQQTRLRRLTTFCGSTMPLTKRANILTTSERHLGEWPDPMCFLFGERRSKTICSPWSTRSR